MNGKRLKAARLAANLTQEELAEELQTDKRQVWRWESGKTVPKTETVAEIAKVLKTSMEYLMGQDEPLKESDLTPLERRALEAFRRGDIRAIIKLMPEDKSSESGD